MEKLIKPSRLIALVTLIVLLAGVFLVSMYQLQIIKGEENYQQSRNSISTRSTVAAARGTMLDRYGRVLVSNRTCNNLIINETELFEQEDPNAIILQLAQEVKDSGNTYTDTLPITKEPPFEYITNMSEIQRTRLDAYLKEYKLPSSTTAVELMAYFRKAFSIDNNYTAQEMRIIAGVRYEVKTRWIINTSDYIFAEDVSIDLITRLMETNVPGFEVRQSYVRDINTDYAAHVLGYVGMMDENDVKTYKSEGYLLNAMVGKSGAELAFEKYLHGVDGEARITSTRSGTIINTDYIKEPQPGNNPYLTIDIGMNEVAELSMSAFITETNKTREEKNKVLAAQGNTKDQESLITGGGVAAINVKTGEPLCIASYPGFDLSTVIEDFNQLLSDEGKPLYNRATMGAYAPGSTFKPVSAIAALTEKIVTTGTNIYDEGQFMKYAKDGYAPTCWIFGKGSHGEVNTTKAIQESCNYYFYYVGDLLGIDKLSNYAHQFGLGDHTGIELDENVGNMTNRFNHKQLTGEEWTQGGALAAAIGQADSLFTPLQIANYCAALANNGVRYEASMLKSVRSYDYSRSLYERQTKVAGTVQTEQEYFDAVHLGMYNVANAVTGSCYKYFGNFPVKVAAKTGTAQLGEDITNNGIFMCYAPYDDPEIAVAVVIEHGGAGSSVVSIAADVMEYYFSFKNSAATMETENSLLK